MKPVMLEPVKFTHDDRLFCQWDADFRKLQQQKGRVWEDQAEEVLFLCLYELCNMLCLRANYTHRDLFASSDFLFELVKKRPLDEASMELFIENFQQNNGDLHPDLKNNIRLLLQVVQGSMTCWIDILRQDCYFCQLKAHTFQDCRYKTASTAPDMRHYYLNNPQQLKTLHINEASKL